MRILAFVLVCFSLWAAMTLWEQESVLNEKNERLQAIQEELDSVKEDHENYQKEVTRLQDPEYIEQRLRKDFQMAPEGETLFIRTQ